MTKLPFAAVLVAGTLALGACSNLDPTEKRVVYGAGGGAAAGALVGGLATGSPITGAIVGGALGAGAGYLYDRHKKGKL